MATGTKKRSAQAAFWKADWFVGIVVVALVLIVDHFSEVMSTIEYRFYDIASTSSARQPSDKIAIIAIDDQSISNIGRWPWSRDVHAKMIDQLASAKAKTIGYTVLFFEPQTDPGLQYIHKIKDAIGVAPTAGTSPVESAAAGADSSPQSPTPVAAESDALRSQLSKIVVEAEQALDTDSKLAASIKSAGNVVVPTLFAKGEPLGKPDQALPDYVAASTIDDQHHSTMPVISGQYPIPPIGMSATAVGHLTPDLDSDGSLRRESLFVDYYGKLVPSMAFMIAAKSLNLGVADMRLEPGQAADLGRLRVRTDDLGFMLPQFYRSRDDKPAFSIDSFYDVYSGKIPASKYANKIVIVGATAAGVGTQFATPSKALTAPAEAMGHIVSSILGEHYIVSPAWGGWASFAIGALVLAYLSLALPRLSAGKAAISTAVFLTLVLVAEFVLLSSAGIWLQLVFTAFMLMIGHLALTTKRFLMTEAGKVKSDEESAETNRMMGLALQGQGQLDAAFDRFRRVPLSDALMENLNSLALDFERKRQFNKAQAAYEFMATYDPNYKDLQSKIKRAKNLSETVMLGAGGGHAGGTLLLDGGGR